MTNTYVVMVTVSITIAHINVSTSLELANVRMNNDGSKSILKFKTDDDIARTVFLNEKWYTGKKILDDILILGEWR